MDVALASCRRLPEPDPDAAPLVAALADAGIDARVLAWDDPAADWDAARLTVLRSTWNYPLQPERFFDWATAVSRVSTLFNSLPVVRWNLHKRYLLDLASRGVAVTPTECVERGCPADLGGIMRNRRWSEAVVKPAISAASYRTVRVTPDRVAEGDAHLRELLAAGDALVQEYVPSVEGYGERALVWIDGELTHAVRKSPRFAGEEESVSDALPIDPAEARLAATAVAAVDRPLLYARIDVAPGPGGAPMVMELELIEPSLFLPQSPAALERFVAAIGRRLAGVA